VLASSPGHMEGGKRVALPRAWQQG